MTAVAVMVADAEPAEYRACDNCGTTYRRELTSHFDDSSAGETTQCWACLGYDGIDEQVLECVEVVDHPGEMGPHQDAFCTACGTLGRADEMDSDGECERCGYLAPGYTSRGDAHLMAVTAPGAR